MVETGRRIVEAAMAYYWSIGRKSRTERFNLDACAKLDNAQKAKGHDWPPRPEGI